MSKQSEDKKSSSSHKAMPVADQLNILFATLQQPNGKPYSAMSVSEKMDMSSSTLSLLRSGARENPSLWTLQKISYFFGIQLDYFDCNSPEECRAYLAKHKFEEYKTPGLAALLRSHGLSDKSVDYVIKTVRYLQEIEGNGKSKQVAAG